MLLDSFEAERILIAHDQRKGSVKAYLDLGFTEEEVKFRQDKIIISDFEYDIKVIEKLAKKPAVFLLDKKPKIIAFFDERYYKLEPIENTAPTIEIDGIRMHRTKHMTPLEDAQRKVETMRINANEDVLDICTGLGYTAIASYRRDSKVTTIEKDHNVIEIAKYNPYSKDLFQGIEQEEIKLILEDASKSVKTLKNESFDAILHDPPRFSHAGELYSEEFYGDLYRILRKSGRLLHYVGKPGAKYRGKDFIKGVQNRLMDVGFKTEKVLDGGSILAYK
ncbi:MAG: methyltransferase [Candidatus Heimdallarchaeota archaeon]|nr:methyltransferase [Candidatus Heimdallarchaeota archaeon]MCK4876704.1 methyltransferase [Candidatus Heimdallarchaeota archaeon]